MKFCRPIFCYFWGGGIDRKEIEMRGRGGEKRRREEEKKDV